MTPAVGLRTHIWNNNLKSVVLLAGFPVLLLLPLYALSADLWASGRRRQHGVRWRVTFASLWMKRCSRAHTLVVAGRLVCRRLVFPSAHHRRLGRKPVEVDAARMSRGSGTCWKIFASPAVCRCRRCALSRQGDERLRLRADAGARLRDGHARSDRRRWMTPSWKRCWPTSSPIFLTGMCASWSLR
jgi:hypothetical protein